MLSTRVLTRNHCNNKLILSDHELKCEDMIKLVSYANRNKITEIHLTRCGIDDKCAQILARRCTAKKIELLDNAIGDAGAAAFATNPHIVELSLQDNPITDIGAIVLAKTTSIKDLSLRKTLVGDPGALAFINHPTIKSLDLGWTNITSIGASALSKCFDDLVLAGNYGITEKGTTEILETKTIKFLDLRNMHDFTKSNLEALKNNTSITKLSLWKRNINDEGAALIAQNKTLTSLDLLANNIGDEGAKALMENKNIKNLDLGENKLSPDMEKKITGLKPFGR